MAASFQCDGERGRPWPGNVFNGSIECIPRVGVCREPTSHPLSHSRRWMASTNNYSGQLRSCVRIRAHVKGFTQQKCCPEMDEAFCSGHVRASVWRDQIILKLIFVVACTAHAAFVDATTWSWSSERHVTVQNRIHVPLLNTRHTTRGEADLYSIWCGSKRSGPPGDRFGII